ncbi:lipopolysaccharide biosynthesis protein [Sporolactobacillus laevolacticus]|uniref:lipopolysaccharide biosynthesis protein n=1 Tax=Sporolactobacillus laevolacticus TaxID=33018 RepID=UPI0025B3356A|nr:hypothetical protein [Sporolactobacillus laevolacticus]MDN3954728.1 hypothetical protein [Sporolactobacillus laevolacticus]
MKEHTNSLSFLYNLLVAFAAQGISLIVSILMSLIVPKLLGVTQFGYWQLFIFYSSYVGFFHFGLNDGIYLRYGGDSYEKLDYKLLGSQFWASVIIQTIVAVGVSIYGFLYVDNGSRVFVFLTVAACMILVNASGFIGYIFQAVNLTKLFSFSVIIDKVFFIFSIFALLLIHESHFELFVILFLLSKLFSLLYCLYKGKNIVLVQLLSIKETLPELGRNIAIGINLMTANIASMLIIGSGQLFIDQKWGIDTFGKISFSLSLTNLFLVFLSQVSMVLFPALRQSGSQNLKKYYQKIRNNFGVIFLAIPLCYFPVLLVLEMWLPQYRESLRYMILLLPLCIFEGKMQVLYNTYLKVLRKEKILLVINIIAMAQSVILILLSVYVLENVAFVVLSMAISVICRSIIAEKYLSTLLHMSTIKHLFTEVLLSIVFVCTAWFLVPLVGFIIYLITYVLYLLINRKTVRELVLTLSVTIKQKQN